MLPDVFQSLKGGGGGGAGNRVVTVPLEGDELGILNRVLVNFSCFCV